LTAGAKRRKPQATKNVKAMREDDHGVGKVMKRVREKEKPGGKVVMAKNRGNPQQSKWVLRPSDRCTKEEKCPSWEKKDGIGTDWKIEIED